MLLSGGQGSLVLKSVVLFHALLKWGGFCCASVAYPSKPNEYALVTKAEHAIG